MTRNFANRIMPYFTLMFCFSLCTNKSNVSLENKIIYLAESCSANRTCNIDLEKITPFEWDSLYVFNAYDDNEYISKIISVKYYGRDVPDGKMRMVFIKGKSVIYEEDFGGVTYNESHIHIFMPIDTGSYSADLDAYTRTLYSISAKQANFAIKKTNERKDCKDCNYYYLAPIINKGKKITSPA